ncbi:hypothetical protein Tco_1100452 [Tanacetum coccineum]
MANDDPILTTMRFIPKHETVQKYGAILPNTLTNQAMKESEAYKTYHDFTTVKVIPKPKYVRRSTREKTDQAPITSTGKRLKAIAKVAKTGKKKQPAQGLETLSEIALFEAEQMKIVTKRSKTQFHSSHTSGSGADEGTDVSPRVPDVPTYGSEDEQISWKQVTMKLNQKMMVMTLFIFSTHNEEERQDEEDKEEVGSDLRVQTPSHFESTDDKAYDEVTQGVNVEGEELNEEEINEEEEVNELYRDVNQSSSVSSGFISNMLNPNPDTGIDSILNLNTESTSLVDVPITTNVEMPPSSFKDRVKGLEDDFLEFKQTNQFAEVVSSIPGIVDTYLANKMNEAVKTVVQLQSDRLRDEAQAENEDFINTLDENMRKIIKKQVKEQVKEQVSKILPKIEKFVNDQLEAEVLTRSSNLANTSHAVAANLSELELKKILIDKMENNKSIDRSIQQKTLYNALVDAYETDKDILETYGDTITFKRRRDDEDKDEEPSTGSNRGSKRRRAGKEPESTSAPKKKTSKSSGKTKEGSKSHHTSTGKSGQAEEPIHVDEDLEEPAHQEFDTGFTKDQPVDETTQHPNCTLAWNKDPRESFNKLMDTSLDFSAFMMNWLKVDTLTLELLAGPTYELMKGSCKSVVELEYFLEEVCKETTDQLDWNNPEGQQYPHDLRKPLPLIPNLRGRRVIPFDHFINNELAYLRGGVSSRTYATSVTKTKAADYGHIK